MDESSFPIVVHNHYHFHESPGPEVLSRLDAIEAAITAMRIGEFNLALAVNQLEDTVALDMSRLESEVSENTDVVSGAAALLATLAQEVRDTAGDPAAVAALADKLDANNQALAAAVAANTPAAPEPAPEEPPAEPVA